MADVSSAYDFETATTIAQVLGIDRLPLVVKLAKLPKTKVPCNSLLKTREVLLQKHLKVKYAHFRILNLEDDVAEDEMSQYDIFGQGVLIPEKYDGKLNIVHRAGAPRQYGNVSQILREMPRFVMTQEETIAFPVNGIGKNKIVPANVILEVTKKFTCNNVTFLECSDKTGSIHVAFSERDRVNFTVVDDTQLYELCDLVRYQFLPKTVKFKDVSLGDIVLKDEDQTKALCTLMSGTLELMSFVDTDIVVGWQRDKTNRTYETFLIRRLLWDSLLVLKRHFAATDEAKTYMSRKYGHCFDTEFIVSGLYCLPIDSSRITFLRSPKRCRRNVAEKMPTFTEVAFSDSSSDEGCSADTDYLTPIAESPAVPAKCFVIAQDEIELPAKKEKKGFFKKLPALFKPSKQRRGDAKYLQKKTRTTSDQSRRREHVPVSRISKSLSDLSNIESSEGEESSEYDGQELMLSRLSSGHQALNNPYVSLSACSEPDIFGKVSDVTDASFDFRDIAGIYLSSGQEMTSSFTDEEKFNHLQLPRHSSVPAASNDFLRASPSEKRQSNTFQQNRSTSPLPQRPSVHKPCPPPPTQQYISMSPPKPQRKPKPAVPPKKPVIELERTRRISEPDKRRTKADLERSRKSQPQAKHSDRDSADIKPKSEQASVPELPKRPAVVKSVNKHDNGSESQEDFYTFSVSQVTQCFEQCGLKSFGKMCSENMLDGKFFKMYDLNGLKEDPFFLSNFEMIKVQKIVREGWRPFIES